LKEQKSHHRGVERENEGRHGGLGRAVSRETMPRTGGGIVLTPLPEKEWEEFFFYHVCLHEILSLAWLMRSRGVSRGWRERIHRSLPLLRGVSFHVSVKGEDVLRALGLVAGGSLQLVGMALCRELSACDIEEILKVLDATCPGVREVDITGCSDEVMLRALAVRALSTLGASPLLVHARLLELAAGTARCPFAAFLDSVQEPMRLLFDPAFAPAEGAFLSVLVEACVAGNETAVVAAALLLGVSFPVDEDDEDDEGETRVFDCNERDCNGRTALHFAAQRGCPAPLFAVLMSAGADVNATNNQDDTPLLAAVAAGNLELVKLLVRAGANLAAKNKYGFTALMLACKENKEEAAALLMLACKEEKEEAAALLTEATQNAAALDVQDTKYKRSALHYASSSGLESIVAKLLSLGADVALKDSWCKTALDVATNDEVKAALRQHGARHSLFYAAEEGMHELVADLIKEGADVNEQNEAGNTAVERAQNAQTIQVLKGAGATMPEMPDEKKNRLLLDYTEEGLTGGVLMALQAGADVNHKGPNSWTALHYAVSSGQDALAQALLGAGADVNAKDDNSWTVLHYAACNRLNALAQALLGAGADVNAKDRFGQTPMFCASGRPDNREVEALLRQHGATRVRFPADASEGEDEEDEEEEEDDNDDEEQEDEEEEEEEDEDPSADTTTL
jgi:ankyrin repeat protein